MKNLDEASFLLGIKIHRDRYRDVLSMSQKAYIQNCSPGESPITKGNKFSRNQCPKYKIPYAFARGSLRYVQVCTRWYCSCKSTRKVLVNPSLNHWKIIKKVIRYLQRNKDAMLNLSNSDDDLCNVGFADSDFVGSLDILYKVTCLNVWWISCESVKQTLTASSLSVWSLWHVMEPLSRPFG